MSCSPASEAVMSLHKAWRAGGGRPEGWDQRKFLIIHMQGTFFIPHTKEYGAIWNVTNTKDLTGFFCMWKTTSTKSHKTQDHQSRKTLDNMVKEVLSLIKLWCRACLMCIPSSDCKVVLHCWSLSPGSAVGKKTAAGIPGPAESRRKPTAVSRACQPGTPPTLFSTLCWDVYMELRWPFCILWRDFSTCKDQEEQHQYFCVS